MSILRRFLGFDRTPSGGADGATESVRIISAELAGLEQETARFLAAFAYVLARVAHVDLEIDDAEVGEMERRIEGLGGLDASESRLVARLAAAQAGTLGGTENYLVTREFRKVSSRAQRTQLLECLFAVAAADGTISNAESTEVIAIAEELGFTRSEAFSVRAGWREHLAELQGLPGPEADSVKDSVTDE